MFTKLFKVSLVDLKRIGIKASLVMAIAGLSFLEKNLQDIIANPFALTVITGGVDYLVEFLTDEKGRFAGIVKVK